MNLILVSILSVLSLFNIFNPSAAVTPTNRFRIYPAAGFSYFIGGNIRPNIGGNDYLSLVPSPGHASFATTSGGSFNCPTPTATCGGMKVYVSDGDPSTADGFLNVLYASPTNIVVYRPIRNFYGDVSDETLAVFTADGSGNPVTWTHTVDNQYDSGITYYANDGTGNCQPFIGTLGVTYVAGSLYGYDGTYLKSLTDGTPNPRVWNSHPTTMQVYFTGIRNHSVPGGATGDAIRFEYEGSYVRHVYFYKVSNGIYVTNLDAPSGNWGVGGTRNFKVGYGTVGVFSQPAVAGSQIYWD